MVLESIKEDKHYSQRLHSQAIDKPAPDGLFSSVANPGCYNPAVKEHCGLENNQQRISRLTGFGAYISEISQLYNSYAIDAPTLDSSAACYR